MASTPLVVNTAEEAAAIRNLLPTGARILLVTSAFHMRSAQRLFARQGLMVLPVSLGPLSASGCCTAVIA